MKKLFFTVFAAGALLFSVGEAKADYPPSSTPGAPELPTVGSNTGTTSNLAVGISIAGATVLVATSALRKRNQQI